MVIRNYHQPLINWIQNPPIIYRGLKCPSSPYRLIGICVAEGVPHQLLLLLLSTTIDVPVTGLRHRLPLARGRPVLLLGLRKPLSSVSGNISPSPSSSATYCSMERVREIPNSISHRRRHPAPSTVISRGGNPEEDAPRSRFYRRRLHRGFDGRRPYRNAGKRKINFRSLSGRLHR